ncbi:MAG: hypothetical protein WB767_12335, partial [Nocardioides sp.]
IGVPVLAGGDDGGSGVDVAGQRTSVAPAECPDPPVDVETLDPATELPDGAAWARMCSGTFSGATSDSYSSSLALSFDSAPVTEDVDALLGAIRDLPAYDELEPECAAMTMLPTPWTLVVGYPDGSTATIGSTVTLCGAASVDRIPRSSQAILELVGDASNEQSDEQAAGAAACPEPVTGLRTLQPEPDTYEGQLSNFRQTTAAACYGPDPLGSPEYQGTQGELDADARFAIISDLGENTTARPAQEGGCTDSGPTRLVVLADDEGRRITLTDSNCTGEFSWAQGFWQAGQDAEAAITQALGGRLNQG